MRSSRMRGGVAKCCCTRAGVCGQEWDLALSYNTPRFVQIRDRRLGLTYWGVTFLIFLYIVIYDMGYVKSHLKTEVPVCSVGFHLKRPTDMDLEKYWSSNVVERTNAKARFLAPSELRYCEDYEGLNPTKVQHPCIYLDENGISPARLNDRDALRITTATRVHEERAVCHTAPAPTKSCDHLYEATIMNETQYVADVESFEILIDHQGSSTGALTRGSFVDNGPIVASSTDSNVSKDSRLPRLYIDAGPLADSKNYLWPDLNSSNMSECVLRRPQQCFMLVNGRYDVFSVGTLLEAANVHLDKPWKENMPPGSVLECEGCEKMFIPGTGAPIANETYRHHGITLQLIIEYDNLHDTWFIPNPAPSYNYRVQAIDTLRNQDDIWETGYFGNRTVSSTHAIEVSAKCAGRFGVFDMFHLLVFITANSALIAAATMLVDKLAIYCAPEKRLYKGAKYKSTENFSGIRNYVKDHDGDPSLRAASLTTIEQRLRLHRRGITRGGADARSPASQHGRGMRKRRKKKNQRSGESGSKLFPIHKKTETEVRERPPALVLEAMGVLIKSLEEQAYVEGEYFEPDARVIARVKIASKLDRQLRDLRSRIDGRLSLLPAAGTAEEATKAGDGAAGRAAGTDTGDRGLATMELLGHLESSVAALLVGVRAGYRRPCLHDGGDGGGSSDGDDVDGGGKGGPTLCVVDSAEEERRRRQAQGDAAAALRIMSVPFEADFDEDESDEDYDSDDSLFSVDSDTPTPRLQTVRE